jgi:solute carrier family 25 phosphate transporter 3
VDPALVDMSFVEAAREVIKEEGMGALWVGLGPTAFGYLLEGAVKFGTYEILKPFFKTFLSGLAASTSIAMLSNPILAYMCCGAAAGFAASIMLCPMEAIRIRMVSEPGFATGGWLNVGYKILKQEGVGGLCKGINPMISKQVPYTVTKNVSFDVLTKSFYEMLRTQGMSLTTATMFTIPLVSAVLASILSTVTSQPGDMVLSLVNAHKGDRRASEIFQSILKSPRGIGGLFVGFKTRLLHVGVTVTIQLMVYDFVKRLCGIAATGTC